MAFIVIGGMTVKVSLDGAQRTPMQLGTRRRSVDGSMRSSIKTLNVTKQSWRCRTVPLSIADAQQLEGILTRSTNLLLSPSLATDTDANGIANDFASVIEAGITASFGVASGRERIRISASAASSSAYVYQTMLGFEAGEVVSVSVDHQIGDRVGTFEAGITGVWMDASFSTTIGTFGTAGIINTGSYVRTDVENQTVPSGAVALRLILAARALAAGDTGYVDFKDAMVERGSAHYGYSDNSLPVTAFGDFIRGGGYGSGYNTARNVHPELLSVTPITLPSGRRAVLEFALHES